LLSAPWLLLALLGEFPSTFFGMDENIVRVAQFLVARVPDFAKAVHVVRFDIEEDAQNFFIDFRLQLLRERLVQPGKFRPEDPSPFQFAAGTNDPHKGEVQAVKNAIDLGLLGRIKGSHCASSRIVHPMVF
jgi:hypothetical protein